MDIGFEPIDSTAIFDLFDKNEKPKFIILEQKNDSKTKICPYFIKWVRLGKWVPIYLKLKLAKIFESNHHIERLLSLRCGLSRRKRPRQCNLTIQIKSKQHAKFEI